METRAVGREGRTFMVLVTLVALANCQVLFGVDASDLVGPSEGSAGARDDLAGQSGVAGASNDGGAGQAGAAGASGRGGGGAGVGVELVQDVLATGAGHSCVRDHNVARCWGTNRYGQLGNATNVSTDTPTPVPALVDATALGVVRQLALGSLHSCALRDDGRVLCWGFNRYGQLGNATNVSTDTPTPEPALVDAAALGVVRQLALGGLHSCALRDDGRVLCWGRNFFGQLGNATNVSADTPTFEPTLVDAAALGTVQQLAVGAEHSCALRDDGRVLCWGLNVYGQLGSATNVSTDTPTPVPALVDATALGVVRQLALGGFHSCALRDDGRVLCWGRNFFGQLGNATNVSADTPTFEPTLVDDAALGVVRQLSLGLEHSCALRDDGRVLCWGFNRYGELGTVTNVSTDTPTPEPALVDAAALGVVRQLALGSFHSCALRDDGRVLCWGSNDAGQLGSSVNVGEDSVNPTPLLVNALPPLLP